MRDQNQKTIQDKFKLRRRRQFIAAVPIVIAAVWLASLSNGNPMGHRPVYVIILALGGLLFSLWNWRCPACNSYLGNKMNPAYCPKCGEKLHD